MLLYYWSLVSKVDDHLSITACVTPVIQCVCLCSAPMGHVIFCCPKFLYINDHFRIMYIQFKEFWRSWKNSKLIENITHFWTRIRKNRSLQILFWKCIIFPISLEITHIFVVLVSLQIFLTYCITISLHPYYLSPQSNNKTFSTPKLSQSHRKRWLKYVW